VRTLLLRVNRRFAGRLMVTATMMAFTFLAYWALNDALAPRFDLMTPLDAAIPFLPWTLPVYGSFYVLVLAAAWGCGAEEFVGLMAALLLANVLCYAGFVLLPSAYPRPELSVLAGTRWYEPFRSMWGSDKPGNTFPSLHVAITFVLALRLRLRRAGALWLGWALLVCASTLTVKQHYLADVVGGIAVALAAHALAFRPPPARTPEAVS
jgi:membrane-associated phospholipid phosphatase